MKSLFFAISWMLITSAWADPECNYNFTVSNATILLSEDPQMVEQTASVNRDQQSPDGRCKVYRIFFGKGLANSYQRKAQSSSGKVLPYNLHGNISKIGILKDFNDAVNSSEFLQGNAPNKFTTYSSDFYVSVPGLSEGGISSGVYYDIIQASVYGYNESSGNYLFEETRNMTLVFTVAKKIEVSLVDENGSFDPAATTKVLDFGILSQGAERGADLRVVSNTPYQVRMSSQNDGKLKLQEHSIAYSLRVNNQPVGLSGSSGGPVTIGGGSATSSAGDRYNLRVQITGNTQNMPAGLYQDAVTITAIAN